MIFNIPPLHLKLQGYRTAGEVMKTFTPQEPYIKPEAILRPTENYLRSSQASPADHQRLTRVRNPIYQSDEDSPADTNKVQYEEVRNLPGAVASTGVQPSDHTLSGWVSKSNLGNRTTMIDSFSVRVLERSHYQPQTSETDLYNDTLLYAEYRALYQGLGDAYIETSAEKATKSKGTTHSTGNLKIIATEAQGSQHQSKRTIALISVVAVAAIVAVVVLAVSYIV